MREFFSPAKINLFFRVLRRRSDGYHEIASLMQAIDLYDRIFISQDEADSLTCSDPELSCGRDNLIIKAVQLFRSRFLLPFGVKVHLEKQIPMQAGLGGGSGNAATTLWGLNELSGWPASLDQLVEMGAALGSDVPFFFSQGTAYCTGRGESLEPVTLPYSIEGWLIKPPFGLSTPLVYQETRPEELPARDPREGLAGHLHHFHRPQSGCERPSAEYYSSSIGSALWTRHNLRHLDALAQPRLCGNDENSRLAGHPLFYNDLEPAALRLEPRLISFRNQLERMGFDSVAMSGSGTAFFCVGQPMHQLSMPWARPFRSLDRTSNRWYQIGNGS